jgi:hypothetical protein
MFVFELDEVLFKLAVNRPHFEPLFQLPPCWKTRFTVRLKDLISSFPLLLYVHPLMWGRESPTPPYEGI